MRVEVDHICDEHPCRCVGRETKWDECACTYVGFARCRDCGVPMKKISVSTGGVVMEHCKLHWQGRDDGRRRDVWNSGDD